MKVDIKRVKNCIDCGNILKRFHIHHFRCDKCWYDYKCKLALGPIEIKKRLDELK